MDLPRSLLCLLLLLPAVAGAADSAEQRNTDLAVEVLAEQLAIDATNIQFLKSRTVEWPDTSLGCPRPGFSYAQVITPGHLVHLAASGDVFALHVGNGRAVICSDSSRAKLEDPAQQRLADMRSVQRAREDLENRVAEGNPIRLVDIHRQPWGDEAMLCPSGDDIQGIQVEFAAAGKSYFYRIAGDQLQFCGERTSAER